MNDQTKQIHDWQDKVKESFSDEGKLHDYLLTTMDQFLYRYLETTENKNLKTQELAPYIYGGESFESSMVEALKTTHTLAKAGIMDLAKSVPKNQKPTVKYRLQTRIKELHTDKGHLTISASISWDHPHFMDKSKMVSKEVDFKYKDLGEFRKKLAIKLEEACEIFN